MSQPAISTLIRDLEDELHISIFDRTSKGISVTPDGRKLISYAQKMADCESEILTEFSNESDTFTFTVSSQHFGFVKDVFLKTIQRFGTERYRVHLRETTTANILQDVSQRRNEIGFIVLKHLSQKQLGRFIREQGLKFNLLFTGKPFVFLSSDHPLAGKSSLTLDDLAPYPCISYDQEGNMFHLFSEEVINVSESAGKTIIVNDLFTTTHMCKHINAYDIGTGIILSDPGFDVIAVPLVEDFLFDFGYVSLKDASLSPAAEYMIEETKRRCSFAQNNSITE